MNEAQERPTDALEQAQELMGQVRVRLAAQDYEAALTMFVELHPAGPGRAGG